MSSTASSAHDGDLDLESQLTDALIASNPPRDRWRCILFILQERNLISRADKANNSLALDRVSSSTSSYGIISIDETGDADPQITEIVEISSPLPEVSFEVHLDVENDCSMSDAKLQHAAIARTVKEKDLDSLQKKFGGIPVIAEALGTDLENGIPVNEEHPCWRIASENSTKPTPAQGFLHSLLKSSNNYTILLLFLSAVLSLSFGIKEEGPRTGWFEGVIIIFAIIILVVGPAIRDFWLTNVQQQSEKHMPLEMRKMEVYVIRGGNEQKVSISDVLLGDVVCLKSENLVPADGLFISGEFLKLDDGLEINDNNPFLFYGAIVTEGTGRMLVTSVGMDTTWGELMNRVRHTPNRIHLPVELDKVSTGTQITGLSISILILVALFLRFMLRKEDVDAELPDLKGKPTASKELLDAIMRIVKKPNNGKISALTTSLATFLVGIMEGVPFVITLAIGYWNKKTLSDKAFAQEPLACVTMGSVTTICIGNIHKTGCGEADECRIETRKAVESFKNVGVDIIVIAEDDVSELKGTPECGLLTNSDRLELVGEEFRNYTNEERMEKVDKISMIRNSLPFDKLLLVQCLKDNGQVVAMVGLKTNEIPALKEADVGIAIRNCSSKTARESSDIIICDCNVSVLVTIITCGRRTYDNIRKYIQLELCMNIAGPLITSIATMSSGFSPITALQLLLANFVVALLGGLALLTEPLREELMKKPSRRLTEPLITKVMWRNLVTQALYQTSILLIFQFKGQAILGISNKVSKTIIFNGFVLCQVFNLVNAREPEKKNMFRGIHQNLRFWVAVGGIMVLQVAYTEIAHILVHNARLNWWQWFICLLIGMVSWAVDWATKWTSGYITDWLTRLPGSHIRTTMAPSADSGSTSNLELPLINGNSTSVPS